MAIIKFDIEHDGKQKEVYPEGSYCSLGHTDGGVLILWETFKGHCIKDRERNGAYDSDFFMMVWDDSLGEAYEVMYATTRGWSYPAMASYVDAEPEVIEKYESWKERERLKEKQRNRVNGLKARHQRMKEVVTAARKNDLRVVQVKRISNLNPHVYEGSMKLLTSNLRSGFRKSLKAQLIQWLVGDSKYEKPFSPRQEQCL